MIYCDVSESDTFFQRQSDSKALRIESINKWKEGLVSEVFSDNDWLSFTSNKGTFGMKCFYLFFKRVDPNFLSIENIFTHGNSYQ